MLTPKRSMMHSRGGSVITLPAYRLMLDKVGARKVKLDRMYSDPDLEMTKDDYLKQKGDIDAEREDLETRIETAQAELAKVHAPVSLETFDKFMAEIRRALAEKVDPSPAMRRQVLQMLHVKVLMAKNGEPDIKGWFRPEFIV